MTSMLWEIRGTLEITVHGSSTPTGQEWDEYLRHIDTTMGIRGLRVIVYSHGGGPDGGQRRKLIEKMQFQTHPVAHFTNNLITRGIGTAIGWFNRGLKVFKLEELEEGYRFLQLTDEERHFADACIQRLSRKLREPGEGRD
jgi:hypothetical protein